MDCICINCEICSHTWDADTTVRCPPCETAFWRWLDSFPDHVTIHNGMIWI